MQIYLKLLYILYNYTIIQIIAYDGRMVCQPKFQGLRAEYLTKDFVAVNSDTVVVVDSVDAKILQVLEASSGRVQVCIVHV